MILLALSSLLLLANSVLSDHYDNLRFLGADVIVVPPPLVLNLTHQGENLYSFPVSVGTPPVQFDFYYDLQTWDSFIGSTNCLTCGKKFNRSLSTSNTYNGSNISAEFVPLGGFVNGTVDADVFTFGPNNKTGGNAGFILADNSTIDPLIQGIISFGYNYKGRTQYVDPVTNFTTNMNILEALYKNYNQTTNLAITQRIFKNNTGVLYLGGYPQDIDVNNENYTKCSIPTNSKTWRCKDVSHILVGNDYDLSKGLKLKSGGEVSFSTLAKHVVAPNNTYDYLVNSMPSIKNCSWPVVEGQFRQIICQKTTNFTDLKDVHIVINNYAYRINKEDLFVPADKNNLTYKLVILQHNNDSINDWIVGQVLLKNYDMVFDQNKNEIAFNGGFRHKFSGPSSSTMMWIIIGIGALVVIVVAVFVSCYCCKKSPADEYRQQN